MTLIEAGFLALVFVAVFGAVAFGFIFLSPDVARQRLEQIGGAEYKRTAPQWIERAARATKPLAKLSLPDEGAETSGVRRRFLNAGIRNSAAPMAFFGAKTILALALPLAAYTMLLVFGTSVKFQTMLFLLLLAASIGYYLPNVVLTRMIAARQREIFESFPDALDLMTVCVEAGLGIEAALGRVADDIAHKSQTLSEELRLVGLELRAGSDRQRALRNLALRTGVEEIETWVSMLIQADRFGTSIAAALRVHSDMLRTKRRQRAEEAAAKIALKLLFPLIFCVFPSLLLVLLGPAFIQIMKVLIPAMKGGML